MNLNRRVRRAAWCTVPLLLAASAALSAPAGADESPTGDKAPVSDAVSFSD